MLWRKNKCCQRVHSDFYTAVPSSMRKLRRSGSWVKGGSPKEKLDSVGEIPKRQTHPHSLGTPWISKRLFGAPREWVTFFNHKGFCRFPFSGHFPKKCLNFFSQNKKLGLFFTLGPKEHFWSPFWVMNWNYGVGRVKKNTTTGETSPDITPLTF